MLSTIIIIIFGAAIGLYHDLNKPTEYELSMEDGSSTYLVLQKNSKYACPLYCEADHIHHAVICQDDIQKDKHQFLYHISNQEESGVAIYCSNKKILSMNRFKTKTNKDKTPNIITASTDE